jgi:hypothetical protein
MPKTPNPDLVAFRMNWPVAEYARLQDHAGRVVKPIAHLIRDAVAEYLDRREEPGEIARRASIQDHRPLPQ